MMARGEASTSSAPRGGRAFLTRWGKAILYALLAAFVLIYGLVDFDEDQALSRGEGTPGQFTVAQKHCSWLQGGRYSNCSSIGDFTSSDGAVTLRNVEYDQELEPGERVPAVILGDVHDPEPYLVAPLDQRIRWFPIATMIAGGLGLVGIPIVAWLWRRNDWHTPRGRHARKPPPTEGKR
ncbi:hypothetical protein ACMYYO_01695 [Dermacoccaceae bacterium W4C1]